MTVRDYLNQLPEPHRSRALKYENEDFDKEVDTLKHAVYEFEYWDKTIEGHTYWEEIAQCKYDIAIEIRPITPEEQHLIEPNNTPHFGYVKGIAVPYTVEFSSQPKQNPIDWLYLQYEIYGYLTPQMVEKAKEKAQ